jgi:hypothetical protein
MQVRQGSHGRLGIRRLDANEIQFSLELQVNLVLTEDTYLSGSYLRPPIVEPKHKSDFNLLMMLTYVVGGIATITFQKLEILQKLFASMLDMQFPEFSVNSPPGNWV